MLAIANANLPRRIERVRVGLSFNSNEVIMIIINFIKRSFPRYSLTSIVSVF